MDERPAGNLVAGNSMIGEEAMATPPPLSRIQRRENHSLSMTAPTMGVPRMNTHIFLALSFLALGATARPLNGAMDDGSAASGLATHDVPNASGGGIVEHVADSFFKYLRSGSSDQTLVLDRPPTPPPDNTSGEVNHDELVVFDDPALAEQERAQPARIELPPSLSAALSFAKMLQNMRDMFTHVAIQEGQERGIIPVNDSPLLIQNGGGELLFAPDADTDEPIVRSSPKAVSLSSHVKEDGEVQENDLFSSPGSVSVSVEVDSDDGLAVPGAFDSPRPAKNDPAMTPMDKLFTIFDPYAALAMSAITASLVVVLVIMWRYYAKRTIEAGMLASMRAAEEGFAGKSQTHYAPDVEKSEKVEEEFNEKQEFALDGPASNIGRLLEDGSAEDGTDSQEDQEAKKALRLLMEVANAAAFAQRSEGRSTLDDESVPRSSNLIEAVTALRSAASTPRPSLCVPRPSASFYRRGTSPLAGSCVSSESDTESNVYASAAASPSSSPPKESSFNNFTFPTSFPANTSDYAEEEEEEDDEGPMSLPVYQAPLVSASGLPSAQLTHVALDLALNLPGTEWVFQFLVIFVSWFGMFMRPAPRR